MAACYAAIRIIQRRRKRREEQIVRKILRDHQNPFSCDEDVFIDRYGFDKDAVLKIHELIAPLIKRNIGNPAILKVLVSLHILRTGCFQNNVGNKKVIPMTQSTMSRAFDAFLDAIIEISSSVIEFPTLSEFMLMEPKFFGLSKIPNVMGVVKCFPVFLSRPNLPEKVLTTKKNRYCITVQIVCDSNLVILDANVLWPGDRPSSEVWMNCDLRNSLKEHALSNPGFLLADECFPLEPWLLVPYEECQKAEELVFNDHLTRALDVGKQCFSMLQTRFKAINHKWRPLYYSPSKVSKIIVACLILHNIGIKLNQELKEPLDCEENCSKSLAYSDMGSDIQENILKNEGMLVRDQIAKLLLST